MTKNQSPTYTGPTPAALTKGVSFQVIDMGEKELTLKADATGTATGSTPYLSPGIYWRVERIVILSGSAAVCALTVYRGDTVLVQRGRDWTPLPPGDVGVAEYPSYLNVYPTECLTFQITGAAPGDLFDLAVQYQAVSKVLGQWNGNT